MAAATPLAASPVDVPSYRVVTPYAPAAKPGMPGPYQGQAVRVHSENSIDAASGQVIRDSKETRAGQRLRTKLAAGEISSEVKAPGKPAK